MRSAKDIELLIGSVNGEMDFASMDWDNYPGPVTDYMPLYKQMKENNENNAGVYGRFYPFAQEGNTYLYYWEYAPAKEDVIAYSGDSAEVSSWSRALHCMDICFAFGTLEDGYTS